MMIEAWLASFLLGFFIVVITILVLHKASEWGCLGIIILFLIFLFWGYAFDFYPIRSLPTDISPSQNMTGRLGWFLGAASTCIWLDTPKGEKIRMLISVNTWGKFMSVTAVYLIAMIECDLIFSNSSVFTGILIGTISSDNKKGENGYRCFVLGSILFIATAWIWWHWEASGYAAALYEMDMTKRMLSILVITSFFYGRSDTPVNNTLKKLKSIYNNKHKEAT